MTFALTGPLVPLALLGYIVVVPRYGPFGASLVTASVEFIGMVIGLVAAGRLWGVVPPLGTIVRTLFVSLLVLAAALMWPTSGLFIFVKLFVLTGVAIACYWALQEFTRDEMTLVRSLVMGSGKAMHRTNDLERIFDADPIMHENARPGQTAKEKTVTP